MQIHNGIEKVATTQLAVSVMFDQATDHRPAIAAYAFDCGGQYLTARPVG